jgi:hypothetical protein
MKQDEIGFSALLNFLLKTEHLLFQVVHQTHPFTKLLIKNEGCLDLIRQIGMEQS